MDNELLVKSIRSLCKKNNISVSQLENELNFGAGLISRWAKSSPSLDKIVTIADYFNVPIDEAIGRNLNTKSKTTENFIDKLYNITINNDIIWENKTDDVTYMVESEDCNIEDDGYEYYELYTARYGVGNIYLYTQYDKEKGVISDIDIQLYVKPSEKSELVIQTCDDTKSFDLWYYINAKFNGELDEVRAEEFKNNFISDKIENPVNSYSEDQLKQITKNMVEMDPELSKLFESVNDPQFIKLVEALKSPKLQESIQLAQRLGSYYSMMIHDFGHNIKKAP